MKSQVKKADLVLEGGGVRGIGLVGALSVFENAGYEFVHIAGTSSGSIVATLLAAGYTGDELKKIIMGIGFNTFTDAPLVGRIPLLGPIITETFQQGLYKGDTLQALIRDLLATKGIHTFKDFILPEYENNPRYRFKVRVIASDISRRRKLVLPDDITAYGIRPEDFDVSLAVRMSISIPFFFTPVKLNGGYIVDGGLLSNYPVELFDSEGIPEWPTFGIKLVMSNALRDNPTAYIPQMPIPHPISGPIEELIALFYTAIEAPGAYYLENNKYVRTTTVNTLDIKSTDFRLSTERKADLYNSGIKAAQDFLQHWDFAKYIAEFRNNGSTSRRRDTVLPEPMRTITTIHGKRR